MSAIPPQIFDSRPLLSCLCSCVIKHNSPGALFALVISILLCKLFVCDKKIKVASVKSQCDSSTLLLKFVIMLRLTVCYSHAVRYVDLSCEALCLSILNLVLHITSINTFALFYRKLPYTDIRDVNLSCAVVLWYEIDCRGLFQRTASW